MGYTPEYWERNRNKILKERREKYQTDPAYRQQALERSRVRREKLKSERELSPKKSKAVVTLPNGETVTGYTVQHVAAKIGISPEKPKYYFRQGYTPAALVSRPKRLYTENQIDLMHMLEHFLHENRAALRTPTTGAGLDAQTTLKTIIENIFKEWTN